jgi:hypothetical protein
MDIDDDVFFMWKEEALGREGIVVPASEYARNLFLWAEETIARSHLFEKPLDKVLSPSSSHTLSFPLLLFRSSLSVPIFLPFHLFLSFSLQISAAQTKAVKQFCSPILKRISRIIAHIKYKHFSLEESIQINRT